MGFIQRFLGLEKAEVDQPLEKRDSEDLLEKTFQLTMGAPPVANVPFLNERTALMIPAVWQARNLIAQTIAGMPLNVWKEAKTGQVKQPNHAVHRIWNLEPNLSQQTPMAVREAIIGNAFIFGNGFGLIRRDNDTGEATEIFAIDPYRMKVDIRHTDARPIYFLDGHTTPIDPDFIFHLIGPSPDASEGYRLIRFAAQTFSLARSIETFGLSFFGNNCSTGGSWDLPPSWTDEQYVKWLRAHERDYAGPEKGYRDRIGFSGAKWNPGNPINNNEGQFLDADRNVVINIARFAGIPPTIMFDRMSGNYNSAPDLNRRFLEYGLMPWLIRYEQTSRKMFLPSERNTYYCKHDLDHFLRADKTARVAANVQACGGPYLTVNEIRQEEGLPSYGPEGDVLYPPPNMTRATDESGNKGKQQPDNNGDNAEPTDTDSGPGA